MLLTPKETFIIDRLLREKGISYYELHDLTPEGSDLPGSEYECELESLSGDVVTLDKVFAFWLGWDAPAQKYTLSKHGSWHEVDLEQVLGGKRLMEAQRELQRKHSLERLEGENC